MIEETWVTIDSTLAIEMLVATMVHPATNLLVTADLFVATEKGVMIIMSSGTLIGGFLHSLFHFREVIPLIL